MNNNRNRENNRDGNRDDDGNGNGGSWSWWDIAAGVTVVAAGATAIGVGLYIASRETEESQNPQEITNQQNESEKITRSLQLLNLSSGASIIMNDAISESCVVSRPHITNLNALLHDIYVRYIALKKEEFERHYRVYIEVIGEIHRKMKEVDEYYQRYSSDVKFAGSHYDNLRTTKPDEFDMVFVIGLPVNMDIDPFNPEESDIVIEQNCPGYVQLRAGTQYQKILIRDGVDCLINRTAHHWMDDRKYILRSKFISWFKSVGTRALNKFMKIGSTPLCYVDGIGYTIRTTESGPAWTLIIEAPGFKLDVDMVPALKFPETRWPVGKMYKPIPNECKRDYWIVVPKPNKNGNTVHDENRSWRIGLQDQEKQLFKNTYALRQTIRFHKKLRDSLRMDKIASYYIKTIFFWEIMELKVKDPHFWMTNDISTLFKYMLKKFYQALDEKKILYFWNRNYNMIGHVEQSVLNEYKSKISNLLSVLDNPANYKEVAKYLLSSAEYSEYYHLLY